MCLYILYWCLACVSILSGSYDHTVKIHTYEGTELLTLPAHSAPVTCLSWISSGWLLFYCCNFIITYNNIIIYYIAYDKFVITYKFELLLYNFISIVL